MTIDVFFIGQKTNPFFMVEINRKYKHIIIYQPDKYSKKNKDFCEQYYLGDIGLEMPYDKIIYMKKDLKYFKELDDTDLEGSFIVSELIIQLGRKYVWVKDKIEKQK